MSEDYKSSMDQDFTPNIQEIGASSNPFQHQTEALKARIFHGASKVEFSFFGQGKTNKENPGPESFGKREREDMRALAQLNKVETSTHATVGIEGLSGFDGQNGFNSEKQQKSLDELKKAIDFASEASTGGAVVFHVGDGPRSMWSNFDREGEFQLHEKEKEEEIHYLVDPEEKRMIGAVKEDSYMFIPLHETNEDGSYKYVTDEKGEFVLDEITQKPIPIFKQSDGGDIETEKVYFKDYKKRKEEEYKREGKELVNGELKKAIVKDFFELQQEMQIQYQLGQARYYLDAYKRGLNERGKIVDSLKYYKELKEKIPDSEWEKNFVRSKEGMVRTTPFTIPDNTDPVEFLEEALKDNVREIGYGKEIALSGIRQAKDAYDKVKKAEFLQDYSLKESTKQMAKAAIYAYKKTQDRITKGDEFLKKNPLYIAPESWRPESYGGHPDEMKKIVQKARDEVVNELKNSYGAVKAKKIADQTIRATIDIGHLNTWKKHYVRKEGETDAQFDKRFKNWVLTKTEDLAKQGIVGHVHLSDNFGYDDEHLTIGDGNAPVKEFVDIMRKNGIKDFIVEGGSFNPMTALPDSWSHLGSPIYRVGSPAAGGSMDAWGQFHQSYFGGTEGPRYIVGDYAPSDDFKGSPFYSGTPLE